VWAIYTALATKVAMQAVRCPLAGQVHATNRPGNVNGARAWQPCPEQRRDQASCVETMGNSRTERGLYRIAIAGHLGKANHIGRRQNDSVRPTERSSKYSTRRGRIRELSSSGATVGAGR
jgi:hypothetical protein